ncbi:recombinase family protein [uncultured Enterovirga sp.]|uniref:recombinase family protein n=1 Tax=uncultured Enterovirga sp. TaxID=2026352 RepID=UPI0035CBC761
MIQPAVLALRCAIYTRVSTEHGLEQEFNSLDNQREAAEAYVKSQAHEGWRCLPGRYDDGGFSGGSMERPALQRLLAEIAARRVDVVVVYKVDRLTRSLSDFAKLVELFDAQGVSFVSVTQSFNTTSSMGRLTLNVLLSFAQFEREVTGERIRDKIAASKKKGIWMGGVVPLGYRASDRALHVVEEHAALIREVYDRYLALGSVTRLAIELQDANIVVPERVDGGGRSSGGKPFSRGHLYALLQNRVYVGQLSHKGRVHAGQHPPIVDPAIFDAVKTQLAAHAHRKDRSNTPSEHLLTGRLRDDRGHAMSPTHAQKGSRRYRYYVSQAVQQGRKQEAGSIARVPAAEIEAVIIKALRSGTTALSDSSDAELVETIREVTVRPDILDIELVTGELIQASWTRSPTTRQREIIVPSGGEPDRLRPARSLDRTRLLRAIALGRGWLDEIVSGRIANTDAIASREGCSERSVRMTLSLAFLSPEIVRTIVQGGLPRGIGLSQLAEQPASWHAQHDALGL